MTDKLSILPWNLHSRQVADADQIISKINRFFVKEKKGLPLQHSDMLQCLGANIKIKKLV